MSRSWQRLFLVGLAVAGSRWLGAGQVLRVETLERGARLEALAR